MSGWKGQFVFEWSQLRTARVLAFRPKKCLAIQGVEYGNSRSTQQPITDHFTPGEHGLYSDEVFRAGTSQARNRHPGRRTKVSPQQRWVNYSKTVQFPAVEFL